MCLRYKRLGYNTFLEKLSKLVRPFHGDFADRILKLSNLLKSSTTHSIENIKCFTEASSEGISAYVIPSVLWSLYCFLVHPDDFFKCVFLAISAGGETNSTAAMVGCICGTFLGLSKIKAYGGHMASLVNDNNTWDFEELVQLAKSLYNLKSTQY
eukprot:TRINITY_DN7388_c0_g1_i3.p1 TRINITY_DN7388_c0_g1~~TRINITY_DN7388_c0_g1_i3.p1  ORF type:complete len:155 (-),score=13.95 TRINITY_DN7388_c0_g1_i3:39-503(-)